MVRDTEKHNFKGYMRIHMIKASDSLGDLVILTRCLLLQISLILVQQHFYHDGATLNHSSNKQDISNTCVLISVLLFF